MSKEKAKGRGRATVESAVSSHPILWSRRSHPTLSQYAATPISKHYEVNRQILVAFDSSLAQNLRETAYTLGLIYVETALLEIPKHGYFYSTRHERERMLSSLEAVRVAHLLKEMIDEGSVGVSDYDRVHVERMLELALMQVQKASEDQFESQRAEAESAVRTFVACDDGAAMREFCWPCGLCDGMHEPQTEANLSRSALSDVCEKTSEQSAHNADVTTESFRRVSSELTANEAPPGIGRGGMSVKSFLTSSVGGSRLDKALYLSGMEVSRSPTSECRDICQEGRTTPGCEASQTMKGEQQQSTTPPHWATISSLYHDDFDHFRACGLIRVSVANTRQGRLPGSTNGCTVIAPLLCMHHLLNDDYPDPGLPDSVIDEVIDAECPAILQELRGKLHLSFQALLIPSDAHDYLIENGQLSQDQFIEVFGGNIVDERHLNIFLDALENSPRRKVACCFYFHEHVVAILRVNRGQEKWYDLIDGLPCTSYVRTKDREREPSRGRTPVPGAELHGRLLASNASRVRCLGREALTVCLRWYACSRFSQDNLAYIDQYDWDEASSDFDPRVFQGFIWGSHEHSS